MGILLHIPSSVTRLDKVLNTRIATATNSDEQTKLALAKITIKRRLAMLPDDEVPAAALRFLEQVEAGVVG